MASALFARPTPLADAADWLPAERPAALTQALGLSGLGGLVSTLPELGPALGGVLMQLVFPSLYIGYFIIRRQLPQRWGEWQRIAVGGLGFGLLASIALLILYGVAEKPTMFAVSGFLFGLFIACARVRVLAFDHEAVFLGRVGVWLGPAGRRDGGGAGGRGIGGARMDFGYCLCAVGDTSPCRVG